MNSFSPCLHLSHSSPTLTRRVTKKRSRKLKAERQLLQPQGRALTRHQPSWHLDFGLPVTGTEKKIKFRCLSHPIGAILFWQPEYTNTEYNKIELLIQSKYNFTFYLISWNCLEMNITMATHSKLDTCIYFQACI